MSAKKGNSYAKGNKGGGRKSSLNADFIKQVEKLCMLGATDKDLADFFEVSEVTINNWKKDNQDFSLALKRGKIEADSNVAESLYKRAMGYEHPEDDIKAYEGEVIITPTIKHYPPDPTSMIFWLKNRRAKEWRDKQDIDVTSGGAALNPITILVKDEETKTEIEKLKKKS